MKNPEYIVGFIAFIVGLFIFKVDTAFKFGEYFIQAIFYIGISILVYRGIKKLYSNKT